MEKFVVSARKYRPKTFDTVVGQKAITDTLQRAISNNNLAQAFLFCGPRGVGKTSCARILAREINEHYAGGDANSDFSLNIFELDAASNNSVDDIRNLTEQVRFTPQVGTHKVYIIDEVHMLSKNAFNAFLKTLEEPPPHAIFILATTEKHKIIPTILSRCQIFDFHRITVKDIADHLAEIAQKEGVSADPEALNIIAEKADGAMRDALSMFDQLVSFSDGNLTYDTVIQSLNILDYDYYFRVVDYVMEHRIPDSLLIFDEILNKGFDGHNFLVGLAQHFRNLMVCKNVKTVNLIETSDAIKARYEEQSTRSSVRFIFKTLELLNDADVQYKTSKNQRLLVELTLIRLCAIPSEKKNDQSKPAAVAEKQSTPKEYVSPNGGATVQEEQPKPTPKATEPAVEKIPPPAPASPTPPKPAAPVEASTTEVKTEQSASAEAERKEHRKKQMKRYQTASVSISAGLIEKSESESDSEKQEDSTAESKPRAADPFSEEQLKETWEAYTKKMRDDGRYSLHSTMSSRPPLMLENFLLKLFIDNSAQAVELEKERGELLDHLRESLNNFSVNIEFEIQKTDQPTGLYTNSQKFEAMVKKNPNLGKLSSKLDLDIY